MNCLGGVVERDARPPIRMAKKQETEQSARPPVFFIFLLLKVFLLFYSFIFLLLKVFLLFYSFTFLLLNHSPPQRSTSSSVSPGVTSFTLKLSKVLLSLFITLAPLTQTSSIWITYIAGVIYSFFIFPLYFFTFFPFTIYIPSGRPSSDEPLRTR